jgi:surface protein
MATSDKLQKLLKTKEQIRHSIEKKGVEIGKDVPFADYPNKISEITSGEGDSTTYENPNFYEIKTNGGTDYKGLFRDYNGTSLDIGNWDTSKVTTMRAMFYNCSNLTSLDIGNWDVRNVESLYDFFYDCKKLEVVDMSNWKTNNLEEIYGLFGNCISLHTIKLNDCSRDTIERLLEKRCNYPGGDINGQTRKLYVTESNVESMSPPNDWEFVNKDTNEVIAQIASLYDQDSKEFRENREIEEVTTMVTNRHDNLSEMFQECENLRTINNIAEWNTSCVREMNRMFENCRSLESLTLDGKYWNTSKVENVEGMFRGCENLRILNLSNFDLSNTRYEHSTNSMFEGCNRLHTLRLDNCNGTTIMKIIGSSDFPTGGAEDYEETRKIYCKKENAVGFPSDGWEFIDVVTGEVIVPHEPEYYVPGYFKGRDIEEATTMVTSEHDDLSEMFSDCENLRTINNISEWDTSNVTTMNRMFNNCRSLESLDLSSFNTSNVDSMYDMFARCENLKELNLSSFEIRENCDTDWMFVDCRRLHMLKLDDCNEDTIRKIIESAGVPTGDAWDYEGTRQIFVDPDNIGDLSAPENWVFVDCETNEIIK